MTHNYAAEDYTTKRQETIEDHEAKHTDSRGSRDANTHHNVDITTMPHSQLLMLSPICFQGPYSWGPRPLKDPTRRSLEAWGIFKRTSLQQDGGGGVGRWGLGFWFRV